MPASLLNLCRAVADACHVPRPAAVALATDPTARRLLSCAREEIRLLAAAGDWQELRREAAFSLTPLVAAYPLAQIAPDIDRIVDQTCRTQTGGGAARPLTGPVTPQRWAAFNGGGLNGGGLNGGGGGSVAAFRVMEGRMVFAPPPTTADGVVFEYVSNAPVASADGATRKTSWENDADVAILDAYLVELGMRWRFLASLGLDCAQPRALYEQERAKRLTRGGGAPVLSLSPGAAGGGAFNDAAFNDAAPPIDWTRLNLPAGSL